MVLCWENYTYFSDGRPCRKLLLGCVLGLAKYGFRRLWRGVILRSQWGNYYILRGWTYIVLWEMIFLLI